MATATARRLRTGPCPIWFYLCWALLSTAAIGTSGCGPSDPVVAEIADEMITATELRTFVENLPEGLKSPYEGDAARQQYVQSLVDRRLMLLEAHHRGLDTTQAVSRAVSNATRSYLATRYQREVIMRKVEVDQNEIERRVS